MSRFQKLLAATALTGSLLGAQAVAGTPDSPAISPPIAPDQALAHTVCTLAKTKKYILLGNSNHGSPIINQVAFSDSLLISIENCTKSHAYVMEGPAGAENELRDEALDIVDAVRTHHSIGIVGDKEADYVAGFMRAALYGVAINFYDKGSDEISTPQEEQAYEILTSSYTADPKCADLTLIYNVKAHADDPPAFWKDLHEIIFQRAQGDNQPVADGILQNHPDGAVIFYGSGHMAATHGLGDLLGEKDTAWIDIEDNNDSETGISNNTDGDADLPKLLGAMPSETRHPDYIYNVSTQVLTKAITPAIQPAPRHLTKEEFNACRQGLPPDVRNSFTAANSGTDFTYQDYLTLVNPQKGLPPIIASWKQHGL